MATQKRAKRPAKKAPVRAGTTRSNRARYSYRTAAATKKRVAKTRKKEAEATARRNAYRTPMATRQRTARSASNGSGKSSKRIPNKEHIGTSIGKAAAELDKQKKRRK